MGTRHLICIVQNQEYRLAQYGQWDGYPSGQGADIAAFLHSCDLDRFKHYVALAAPVTEEELRALWKEAGAIGDMVTMDVSDRFKEKHPQLSRDSGAQTLQYIQGGGRMVPPLSTDFAADSLFCEWAYVINLDTDELEIYKGFNKKPLGPHERFYPLQKESDEYYPVSLVKALSFQEIRGAEDPAKFMKEFEKSLRGSEDD